MEKWKDEDPTKAGDVEEQNIPEKVWMETKASFHQLFDDQLKIRDSTLHQFLEANDSTSFWKLWSETFENALIQFCDVEYSEAKAYKGRGKTIRKGVTKKGTPTADENNGRCHAAQLPAKLSVMVKQEGRCQSWADRLSAAQKPGASEEKQRRFEKLKKPKRASSC